MVFAVEAKTRTPQISDVRSSIEKKETEKAIEQLNTMYLRRQLKEEDVLKAAKWLSVFLYDDTVAAYEKAIELAGKSESGAQEELEKALAKEPHNKILHQSYITYLLDNNKPSDAQAHVASVEKKYPYFKIFSVYLRYITTPLKKASQKDQKVCFLLSLSDEERDFCRAVFIKELVELKYKADKKIIEAAKKNQYSEVLFLLWEMTSHKEYLKQYVTKCQALSDKEKRSARLFPGVCSKLKGVEPLLKTEDLEE